jgi:hypothetical protein
MVRLDRALKKLAVHCPGPLALNPICSHASPRLCQPRLSTSGHSGCFNAGFIASGCGRRGGTGSEGS